MFNHTDGMQRDAKQRMADSGEQTTTAKAPGFDRRATASAGKAEDIVALLVNRIRHNETRR